MSTYHIAYMAYEQNVYRAMGLIALFAISQVIGWYIAPRVFVHWDEREKSIYLALCAALDSLLVAFPFLAG